VSEELVPDHRSSLRPSEVIDARLREMLERLEGQRRTLALCLLGRDSHPEEPGE
jgi:hypothetical protein